MHFRWILKHRFPRKLSNRTVAAFFIPIGLLALGATLLLVCNRGDATKLVHISEQHITIRELDTQEALQLNLSTVYQGDWLIEAPIGSLVVAGNHYQESRQHLHGAIVGIFFQNKFYHDLTALSAHATRDGVPIKWQSPIISPKHSNKQLGLGIIQVSTDNQVIMRTFITFARKVRSFKIWNRIRNISSSTIKNISVGSSLCGESGFIFVPGWGYVDKDQSGSAPWVAMIGQNQTTAFVLRHKPYETSFKFDLHGPFQNNLIAHTGALEPKQNFAFEQHILIAQGGLNRIAATAWNLSGISTGKLTGNVSPMQTWGEIEVISSSKKMTSIVNVYANGSFETNVPFGTYQIRLITPGGRKSQHVSIDKNTPNATVDFSTIEPAVVHYLIHDETLMGIPARLVVRGIHPTQTPTLGPRYLASGAGNVLYTAKGAGAIELPAGTYRILATHGPEYSIDENQITVFPGRHVSITSTLREEIDRDGWISADFHLHAEPSYDSNISLKDRVISLYAENIDVAIATDHNTVTNYRQTVESMQIPHELHTGVGVEVTTWKPSWGHFNVWPWRYNSEPPPWSAQTPKNLFNFIRQQQPGAVIQVNHPRMDIYNAGYFTLGELEPSQNRFRKPAASFNFDAIEIFNGMNLKHPAAIDYNLNEWYTLLNHGHRFTATGNSDSHFLVGHFAGYPRNYLQIQSQHPQSFTIDDVTDAVKDGRSFVSNGPFLRATLKGATFGDEITVEPDIPVNLAVTVQSASWLPVDYLEIIVDGNSMGIHSLDHLPQDNMVSLDIPLRFKKTGWVIVKVGGSFPMNQILPGSDATPLAFSNPIWVNVSP